MMVAGTPSVFHYMDYRQFLRDAYQAFKSTSAKFSYRYFAQKAGVGSPSFLKLVMEGQRNLSPKTALRFAAAFKLNKQETRFFVTLVAMNQAKTTQDRAHYYEELSRIPKYRETKLLERSQYDYYERWYCIPIRELVARADFQEDPAWIAAQLRPPITRTQAQEAMSLLLALGLVTRDESGRLRQASSLVSTPPELTSLAVRSFHREMLHRAASALDAIPLEEREVGGVTVRLTAAQMRLLVARMAEIRREVLQLDGIGEGAEAVYHFAYQLFPVSQPSADTTTRENRSK